MKYSQTPERSKGSLPFIAALAIEIPSAPDENIFLADSKSLIELFPIINKSTLFLTDSITLKSAQS